MSLVAIILNYATPEGLQTLPIKMLLLQKGQSSEGARTKEAPAPGRGVR